MRISIRRFYTVAIHLYCLSLFDTYSALAQSKHLTYLALGDSYTIGEGVAAHQRWPELLKKELHNKGSDVEVTTIARTGWTSGELTSAINKSGLNKKFDLVSLLIGVNNQYRGYPIEEFRQEFEKLLEIAIRFSGENKERVFVVSIPDYGVTPFGKAKDSKKISKEIAEFNRICQDLCVKKNITFIDITGISKEAETDPSLLTSDGLHPSSKMYEKWVDKMLPEIVKKVYK